MRDHQSDCEAHENDCDMSTSRHQFAAMVAPCPCSTITNMFHNYQQSSTVAFQARRNERPNQLDDRAPTTLASASTINFMLPVGCVLKPEGLPPCPTNNSENHH